MDGDELKYADSSAPISSDEPEPTRGPWLSALLCSLLLAAEIYFLVYDFEPSNRTSRGIDRPVIATLREGINEVRNKSAGTITWRKPQTGEELRREDSLLTMSDAQAFVRFIDGAELRIEPDSLVVLEKTPSENSENYQKIIVRLVQGSLAKTSAGSLPVAIDIPGKDGSKPIRIEDEKGDAVFKLRQSERGLIVQVKGGTVKLGEGKSAEVVKANQVASLSQGQIAIKNTDQAAELRVNLSALTPSDNKYVVRDNENELTRLTWKQEELGKLEPRVHISRKSDLSEAAELMPLPIAAGSDPETGQANFVAPSNGDYFWRVEAEAGKVKSPIAHFRLQTRLAPNIKAPKDGIAVQVGAHVTLAWDKGSDDKVRQIILEISTEPGFKEKKSREISAEEKNLALSFDQPQVLYWRLRTDYGPDLGVSWPSAARKIIVKRKLKAPTIKKPKIRIEGSGKPVSRPFSLLGPWRWIAQAFKPSFAHAQTTLTRNVTVDLEWDEADGANAYRIQISEASDFKKTLVDQKILHTSFAYSTTQTTQTRKLYFRVATLDADGEQSPFTEPHPIDIDPLPQPKVEVKAPPPPPLLSQQDKTPHKETVPYRVDVSIGAAYHNREFKGSDLPQSAIGNGLVPALIEVEGRRPLSGLGTLDVGLSVLAEQATPTTTNVTVENYSMPLIRLWAALEREFGKNWAAAGLYASTSQKFSWNQLSAVSTRKVLLGLNLAYMSSPLENRAWHWRAQLGAVGVGALGADLNATLRHPILGTWSARATDYRGFFAEAEILGRLMTIEVSYGGVIKLGYSF